MIKKFISIFLSAVLFVSGCGITTALAANKPVDFTIVNPYKDVDFDTWKAYKFQPHCHTTASDGYLTIKESIQAHYDYDYDIVAITDHGTANKGWNVVPQTIPIMRAIKKERTGGANNPIIPLTNDEYAAYLNGTAAVSEGFGRRTYSDGLLDVKGGNELNMATPVCDCHLTCYWSEYGQGYAGVYGDYETPAREVNKDGGITMLSHIGEYVYPDKDSADHAGQKVDEYFVNKFARVFLDNAGSCVGMGINSATDAHTRCDRILYDQILMKTIPNNVTPWAFCFSDSHSDTSVNDAWSVTYMPEKTEDALRSCMTNGQLFAVSHYSNGFELNGMQEMEGYRDEDWEKVRWYDNDTPLVTKVAVDEKTDTIKVWGKNFNTITWVSAGNVVLREKNVKDGYAELKLNRDDLLDDIFMYVRFYLSGNNGICYSQPFTVYRDNETFEPVNVPKTHDLPAFLRGLVTVLDWIIFKFNPVIWIFKYFALGYNPVEQAVNSVKDIFR